MKGYLESVMTILGIENSRYKLERAKENLDELHPGRSADIIAQGQKIGVFGELHPNKLKEYDLGKTSALVLEMDLNALFNLKVGLIKAKPYSRFPNVTRDLALVLDKSVEARDVIKTIKTIGKGLVRDAEIFDLYEGGNIGDNMKSLAVTITFGSDERTLSDKEVNDLEEKIKFELNKAYRAFLRM